MPVARGAQPRLKSNGDCSNKNLRGDADQALKSITMDRTRTASQRKAEGAHYTPPALADFVADNIVGALGPELSGELKVLDPACGDGSLLVSLVSAVRKRRRAKLFVEGFDISAEAIERTQAALAGFGLNGRVVLRVEDFLDAVGPAWTLQENLFAEQSKGAGTFDMVIAN
ncbi:MAG: methyltransferase domain-containing protein, partial [Gemmatimonadaceae bacterium]|nr:methyltransferase domain-containing protein [Gemmatimonadaceae bacterium]